MTGVLVRGTSGPRRREKAWGRQRQRWGEVSISQGTPRTPSDPQQRVGLVGRG